VQTVASPWAPEELEAWRQVVESGYERYVATDEASRYEGERTRSWLKLKVPGWTLGERSLAAADQRGSPPTC
jgi:ATP-dependent DNA ligase